jgi:hypothetical protein
VVLKAKILLMLVWLGLTMLVRAEQSSVSAEQNTHGWCSPAITEVQGSVVV